MGIDFKTAGASELLELTVWWSGTISTGSFGKGEMRMWLSELRNAFESLSLLETDFGVDVAIPPDELTRLDNSIFDCDKSGTVDLEEFRKEMRKIIKALPWERVRSNGADESESRQADPTVLLGSQISAACLP
ncbi:hypothetical protein RJ639_001250 [Escallonia herrerae]|uniref:Uncharacterized protein n=1 Tax=Escallonia herrerae TaxID=1293975 RepID=A0AA89BM46_9ASTE|nr:hypothetical protein RJ639_001250 [Escallonia herrerae]